MNEILSPKQQAIRERAQRILHIARELLVDQGYHGLNMDRIAEELQISKGTIYNHFPNKEEIIIQLAIETAEIRRTLFLRASQFDACARFRIMAIGQADIRFFENYGSHFEFERMLRIPSILEKTSEQRRQVMQECEFHCMQILASVVQQAQEQADLPQPRGLSTEEIIFGLWSLHLGAQSIVASAENLEHMGLARPLETMQTHTDCLLDGLGWHPLSAEYDKQQVLDQIHDWLSGVPLPNDEPHTLESVK